MDELIEVVLKLSNKMIAALPADIKNYVIGVTIVSVVSFLLWQFLKSQSAKKSDASITEQSKINEQYTAAIEHLNTEGIGAIYVLEWIAQFSKWNRESITANFVSYIRKNAPRRSGGAENEPTPSLSPEVRAIMTILGRKWHGEKTDNDSPSSHAQIDFSETCLQGINLSNTTFTGDNFVRADLKNATLRKAVLENSDFGEAILDYADLKGANLYGVDLAGASLKRANLTEANLEGANLSEANLEGAILWGANLEGANLWGANLKGADFAGAKLKRARFLGADLTRAIFNEPKDKKEEEIFEGAKDTNYTVGEIIRNKGAIWIPKSKEQG